MATSTRNSKVIALLVGAMTFGAALLLWLEPRGPRFGQNAPLVAQRGTTIDDVMIEFVPEGDAVALSEYDCVVFPDGSCQWDPRSRNVRLLVVGSSGKRLPDKQVKSLLGALANMSRVHELDVNPSAGRVQLASGSDADITTNLPAQARHLRELLVLKQIIRG